MSKIHVTICIKAGDNMGINSVKTSLKVHQIGSEFTGNSVYMKDSCCIGVTYSCGPINDFNFLGCAASLPPSSKGEMSGIS